MMIVLTLKLLEIFLQFIKPIILESMIQEMSPNLAMNLKQIKQLKQELEDLIMKKKQKVVTLKSPKNNYSTKRQIQLIRENDKKTSGGKTPSPKNKSKSKSKSKKKPQITKIEHDQIIELMVPYFIKNQKIQQAPIHANTTSKKQKLITSAQKEDGPPPLLPIKKTLSITNEQPQPIEQFKIFRPSDLKKQNIQNKPKQNAIKQKSIKQKSIKQNIMKVSKGISQQNSQDNDSFSFKDFLNNREKSKTTDHKLYINDQYLEFTKKKQRQPEISKKANTYQLLDMRLNKLKLQCKQQSQNKKKQQKQRIARIMYNRYSPLAKYLKIKKQIISKQEKKQSVQTPKQKSARIVYSFI